jgi:hypothetical protein
MFAVLEFIAANGVTFGPFCFRTTGRPLNADSWNQIQWLAARERPWVPGLVARAAQAAGSSFVEPTEDNVNRSACWPKGLCLVAESHPAGRGAPALNQLRALRDVLRISPWGRSLFDRFHEYYYSFSDDVATRVQRDPAMRQSIGFAIAEPLINYLRMVTRLPRLDMKELDGLPPTVRAFLRSTLMDVHEWVGKVDVGEKLHGLAPLEAAVEMALALRFRFSDDGERRAYLERLVREGVLPLKGMEGELRSAFATLQMLGAAAEEIGIVFGDRVS